MVHSSGAFSLSCRNAAIWAVVFSEPALQTFIHRHFHWSSAFLCITETDCVNGVLSRVLFLSCLDNTSRRRTCITISDDSDDELVTFRATAPVVVKDEDDDDEDEVSILEVEKSSKV